MSFKFRLAAAVSLSVSVSASVLLIAAVPARSDPLALPGSPFVGESVPRSAVDAVPGVALAVGSPSSVSGTGLYRAWASYSVLAGRVGATPLAAASSLHALGITAGIGYLPDPTLRAGLAISYAQTRSTSAGSRATQDDGALTAYAAWTPPGGLELEGQLGAGVGRLDSTHVLPVLVSGDASTRSFVAGTTLAYRARFDTSLGLAFLRPFVGLAYADQQRDSYVEYGPGASVEFPAFSVHRLAAQAGLNAGIDIATPGGWILRPEVSAAWMRDLADVAPPVTGFLNGAPITFRDPYPGRDAGIFSAALTATQANVQLVAAYSAEVRSNAVSHLGRVGLRFFW